MTEFVLGNMETIGTALVALVLILYAIIAKEGAVLKAAVYALMLSAERLMGTEEGERKMEFVFESIWTQMPKWIKVFTTERDFRVKLQEWYRLARDQIVL
jgi:hypothetical protein